MVFTGTTVIIPGVVPHFFCGATRQVFTAMQRVVCEAP
ncbi:hypothetical protein [Enterococcus sp.]